VWIEERVRRLFRNVSATEVLGKEIDAQKATHRRVEIEVERETVSVFHVPETFQDGVATRCSCCGQVIAASQSGCPAHEMEALSAELPSGTAISKRGEA
jgi:hypothetical protein